MNNQIKKPSVLSRLSDKVKVLILTCLLGISSCDREYEQSNDLNTKVEYGDFEVTASLSKSTRSLDPNFMCFNVNTIWVESWRDPDFAKAVNRLNPSLLRFPGGTVANYWDWQRGGFIQDVSRLRKPPGVVVEPRGRQYTAAKLEDFKVGLEATDTNPLFVLNLLTSDLDYQLEMLRKARDLGLSVKYIELGNELYSEQENDIAVFANSEDYAKTARQWTSAIKQEFPEAKIAVIGVRPSLLQRRRTSRVEDWNSTILTEALPEANAITFHLYHGSGLGGIKSPGATYPFFTSEDVPYILSNPFINWQNFQNHPDIEAIPNNKEIWITEYNLFERAKKTKIKMTGSWAQGLYNMSTSLLFLEDQRITNICNHVLIGNSVFGAIFAQEDVFIHPSEKISLTPLSLSATGVALRFLGDATEDMTTARQIIFSPNPTLTGRNGFQYDALYGWMFANGQEMQAAIINLSNQNINVGLSDQRFSQTVNYEQFFGDPRTLVGGPGILTESSGTVSEAITLPAYSVTKIYPIR